MKFKHIFAIVFVGLLCFSSNAIAQEVFPEDNGIYDYYTYPEARESDSHPFRILGYVIHPIGWAFREWIFRPINHAISEDVVAKSVLGYKDPYSFRTYICHRNDGVPNCNDLPPFTKIDRRYGDGDYGTRVAQVYFPQIAFDFNRSTLNSLGKARVRQASQILASKPELQVVVEGHTDYKGSQKYNKRLGMKRAKTVVRELVDLGIDPARLSFLSKGENEPIFTERTNWARAANRRVSFVEDRRRY